MATTKKKAKSSKKPALKKKPAAKKPGRGGKKHHDDSCPTLPPGYSGAPLTPNDNPATANQVPTARFGDLRSYWNLLRPESVYRVVVAKCATRDGTSLGFDIVDPATGVVAFAKLKVDLNNGANTYPYFPSTAQQFTTGSEAKYAYLLLSEEYLEATIGAEHISQVAGPKIPFILSL